MKIYRKRYIPNEIVDISDDEVIYCDDKKLITKWKPIKPRDDIGAGMSCVYFEKGIKVSKFFDADGNFKFWYCDIISSEYFKNEDKYVITDLLVDVVIYEDGLYEVLDEDELLDALRTKIITKEIFDEANQKLNSLLKIIENGKFEKLKF